MVLWLRDLNLYLFCISGFVESDATFLDSKKRLSSSSPIFLSISFVIRKFSIGSID